jgi:hypothetical protein
MLIGVAPIIFGVTILSVGIYGFIHFIKFNQLISSPLGVLSVIFLIYLVFSITNTMFSSRKDLEGLLEFSAIIAFFILILLFVGIILNVDFILGFKNIFLSSSVTNVITLINWLLITPVIINLSFIGIAKLLFRGRI